MAVPKRMHESIKWGVSALCLNEAQMGVLIAQMTLLGCENIAWEPIRPKDPANVRRGVKGGGGRPAGRRTAQPGTGRRKTAVQAAAAYVEKNRTFESRSLHKWVRSRGHSAHASHAALFRLKNDGIVRKLPSGKFERVVEKFQSAKAA